MKIARKRNAVNYLTHLVAFSYSLAQFLPNF